MLKLPENVELILNKLKEHGSIGYVVGGCIRDSFLGKQPEDWDITTPLLPNVVKDIFHDFHVIETGIKHGTVTVVINNESYEITTFRIDGIYSDGRHPDNVNFTDRLEEDLKRRDFTINAMAYNPDTGIIDLFNGLCDLEDGVIRCVGNPEDRFEEDALRILRALRFAITLGFTIERQTLSQMSIKKDLISKVSNERICTELCKTMNTSFPKSFNILYDCLDLYYYMTPYFSDGSKTSVQLSEHFQVIESLIATNRDDDFIVRLALLFRFCDNPKETMANIRIKNSIIKAVTNLIRHIDDYKYLETDSENHKYETRKLIGELGFFNTIELCHAWVAKIIVSENIDKFKYIKIANDTYAYVVDISARDECCTLDDLDISGDDLIKLGFKPGKDIGRVLSLLLDDVMRYPYKNKKKWLIMLAKNMMDDVGETDNDN